MDNRRSGGKREGETQEDVDGEEEEDKNEDSDKDGDANKEKNHHKQDSQTTKLRRPNKPMKGIEAEHETAGKKAKGGRRKEKQGTKGERERWLIWKRKWEKDPWSEKEEEEEWRIQTKGRERMEKRS